MLRASDSRCFPFKQLQFWCIQNKTVNVNSFIQNPKITSVFLSFYPVELSNSVFDSTFVRAFPLVVEETSAYRFRNPHCVFHRLPMTNRRILQEFSFSSSLLVCLTLVLLKNLHPKQKIIGKPLYSRASMDSPVHHEIFVQCTRYLPLSWVIGFDKSLSTVAQFSELFILQYYQIHLSIYR